MILVEWLANTEVNGEVLCVEVRRKVRDIREAKRLCDVVRLQRNGKLGACTIPVIVVSEED